MAIVRAIALFLILAFGGCLIATGFMSSPASANKMDGKPGGYGSKNSANYGTKKPPAKKTGTP